ncbi:hypothetical protein BD769DRAFT_1468045 [Suillus cothurnatus]|nr:hypothetical protein BD769DRAFT_1468045 [Suillus cothurnatus]
MNLSCSLVSPLLHVASFLLLCRLSSFLRSCVILLISYCWTAAERTCEYAAVFSANGPVPNLVSLMSMIVLLITLHTISRLTRLFMIRCITQMKIHLYLHQLTVFVGGRSLLS